MMALSKEPNPTRFQKTLALNDWYLKGEDTDYPWGGIQMLGKSDGEQLKGKAPHFLAWAAKLIPHRPMQTMALTTASTSGCHPRTSRIPTTGSPSRRRATVTLVAGRDEPRRAQAAPQEVRVDAHRPRDAPRPARAEASTSTRRWTSPPPRIRPAPCASGPIRRRRCSTSTARRTSSTTSTWSTRASSRRSAR